VRDPGSNMVVVSGSLPAKSAPQKHVLAIQEPAQHAASTLARLLADRGVKFWGTVRANHDPTRRKPRAQCWRAYVTAAGGHAEAGEQNQPESAHRDIVAHSGAAAGRWAKSDDLLKFPEEFYAKAGIAPGDVVQEDGSGMSRHDLVTPRALVALLLYAQKQSWFPVYFGSLRWRESMGRSRTG